MLLLPGLRSRNTDEARGHKDVRNARGETPQQRRGKEFLHMDGLSVNRAKFEELIAGDKPLLVDFWASWCGPCRMMAPIVEEVAKEHPEIAVAKINVDDEPELAQKYKVMNIPTLLLFRGGDIIKRQIGAVSKSRLEEMFKDL